MKLPSSRFIERAAEHLGNDLTFLHKMGANAAGQLIEDTGRLTKQARYQLRHGATRVVELEDKVVADFRTRPLAYLLVAVGLAVVVSLKIWIDRQRISSDEN